MRRKSEGIVFRLIAFAVFLVVLGGVARMVAVSALLRDEIESVLAAHQQSLARYVADDIDEKIKARLGLLERMAATMPPALLSDPEGLRRWLKERHEAFPLFSRGFLVVPVDGHGVIAEFPVIPRRGNLAFTSADWFLEAQSGRGSVIGRPIRSPADGQPVIAMAVPLPGAAGRPAAILAGVAALASPGLLNLVQENRIGRTGGYLLISPHDRLFVAADRPEMVLAPTPPPGADPLHDRAMAGHRGTGIAVNAQGVEELSAMVSVPTPGWVLVARLPTEEAFEPIRKLQSFILANGLLLLAVVIAILLTVLRRLFRPLADAARQMHRMAEGKADIAPLPVRRMDEVGNLAIGFNFLLGKLREQEAALRESEARMAHLAHHDVLTGLPNRVMFHDRMIQAIARADRAGKRFALLYLDLDGFKPINDTHGHKAGDEVLCEVARRLSDLLRRADSVARMGGDEFAILLTEDEDPYGAGKVVARKCQRALEEPFLLEGGAVTLGVSVGLAVYPDDGQDAAHLLLRADQAMYFAKQSAARIGRRDLLLSDQGAEP
nr:sensor domain-containing diguanylate cyclase [Azospirillum sp. SYSU D00513]